MLEGLGEGLGHEVAVAHGIDAVGREAREAEDERIIRFIDGLSEADLDGTFAYRTVAGKPNVQRRADTLAHFFNHQTHHRGQAHALITRAGEKTGDTDLFLVVPAIA